MGILCAKESGFHICCTMANVHTNIKFLSCPLFASSYTEMLNRFMDQMTFQACYRTFLFFLRTIHYNTANVHSDSECE